MQKWSLPPRIKLYEALGAVADERVKANAGTGRVRSSSGQKSYDVTYDPSTGAINSNDNASYWVGYIGYPAVAYLLAAGVVPWDREVAQWLKGVHWKDLNTRFRNDYSKTETYVRDSVTKAGGDLRRLDKQLDEISGALAALRLMKTHSGRKPPPRGY